MLKHMSDQHGITLNKLDDNYHEQFEQFITKVLNIEDTQLSQLQEENKRLKQALKMVLSQSRIEFDLTAQIIGYTRTKQILGEMFVEQRQHLSNQLQELFQLGQPQGRSFPIENNINKAIQRIRQRLQESKLEEFVDTSIRI